MVKDSTKHAKYDTLINGDLMVGHYHIKLRWSIQRVYWVVPETFFFVTFSSMYYHIIITTSDLL